ncbi:cyclodeaminase/cyclohydrolase family protein [Oribacterium sp. WCC10]|uniref:cyclodeaminase/cyclohydrolase family protein n=1 Tax=Oribacterium sp. WCC10 TaxID=1855343 RepID=UPI0008F1EEE4|nr:cyclodeaminase/cyclohydrolase family protein [Oribacterium sp. WCC10]SFG21388.1 Formiminotetrahydrofolate cyclodeaminase [Oribacterium sp. WCC10]
MTSKEMKIEEYLEKLGAKESVPGGGGASALAGAYGVSLGLMVCSFTSGKKKYADFEPRLKTIQEKLKKLRSRFLELSDEDEKVFYPLSKAYSLPENTVEEKDYKETTLESCLSAASMTPVKVMECACEALICMQELADNGSKLMLSDVGVGVSFLNTAIEGAVMNVYINTKMMKNKNRMIELNEYAYKLLNDGKSKARLIYEQVEDTIRPDYDAEKDRIKRNKVDFE